MPTERHKLLKKKIAENGGRLGKALKDLGYSENYQKSPDKFRKTKSWQELMNQDLPDDLLAKKHRELLNKKEVVTRNNNETKQIDVVETGQLDANAVRAGLDMAYKLKGHYAPEKHENRITIEERMRKLTPEELDDVISGRKYLDENNNLIEAKSLN